MEPIQRTKTWEQTLLRDRTHLRPDRTVPPSCRGEPVGLAPCGKTSTLPRLGLTGIWGTHKHKHEAVALWQFMGGDVHGAISMTKWVLAG